jgi:hypothetical protein
VYGYDVDTGLARRSVHTDSIIIGVKSNDSKFLSDYPEDCAAVYFNVKTLNQNVTSGIYKIWPTEGYFYYFYFATYSAFVYILKQGNHFWYCVIWKQMVVDGQYFRNEMISSRRKISIEHGWNINEVLVIFNSSFG